MSKPGPTLTPLTADEDAAIAAGIAADPDTYEPSGAEIMAMRPVSGHSHIIARKVLLSVRYSPEVVSFFRATGKGWQTRMNDALKEWISAHAPQGKIPSP